jgi:anion-transporting  ArsA/GET3 family ATPase
MISDDSYNRKTGCFAFRAGSLPQLVEEEEREERIPHLRGLRRALARTARNTGYLTNNIPFHPPTFIFYIPYFSSILEKQLATDRIIHSSIQQSSVLKKKKKSLGC